MTTLTKRVVPGSLAAVASQQNMSLAETFLGCDVLILFDTSASMLANDVPVGNVEFGTKKIKVTSRYAAGCTELSRLQEDMPGKIALIAFHDVALFVPGGVPPQPDGSTNLVAALEMAKLVDGLPVKIIVISDGEPDKPDRCLALAATFENQIDCIYIGPTGEDGELFLRDLANATRGKMASRHAGQIGTTVQKLLLPDGNK